MDREDGAEDEARPRQGKVEGAADEHFSLAQTIQRLSGTANGAEGAANALSFAPKL